MKIQIHSNIENFSGLPEEHFKSLWDIMPMSFAQMGACTLEEFNEEHIEMARRLREADIPNRTLQAITHAYEVLKTHGHTLFPETLHVAVLVSSGKVWMHNELNHGFTGFGGIPGFIVLILSPTDYVIERLEAHVVNELIERFGDPIKTSIQESHQNVKNWSKEKWNSSNQEFNSLCKELTNLLNLAKNPASKEVQALISKHYAWLKKFWIPTKDSYIGHTQLILESDLRKAYETYHPNLPTFLANGIKVFANKHLI